MVRIGRLTDQTRIDPFVSLFEPINHHPRTESRRPLLVAGEQQTDGSVVGSACEIDLHGTKKGGDRALHIAYSSPVEIGVTNNAFERIH